MGGITVGTATGTDSNHMAFPNIHEDLQSNVSQSTLLQAFRSVYCRLELSVIEATTTTTATDSNVIARLGDDLDEFSNLFRQVSIYYLSIF
jgi:hypothetical protein